MGVKIIETNLEFVNQLSERYNTNRIILHHSGTEEDLDLSAAQIHQSHIAIDYAGIGYHYVIRKNGDIERGRPRRYVGAHAYGCNFDSIGIHLSGNFDLAEPTKEQVESAAQLINELCEIYRIPRTPIYVKGHGELMSTDCPGSNLQILIPTICGKAIWYQFNTPQEGGE